MSEEQKLNIYQRMHAVMQEVDYVQKERKNGMKYSIISHDAVTNAVRPILVKHKVVYHPTILRYAQVGNRTEVELTLRFVNIDDPTDYIDVPCLGFGIDESDKGPGKAVSYAVKYGLLKALGLETGDDPDNDQDTVHKKESPQERPTSAVERQSIREAEDMITKEFKIISMEKKVSKAGKNWGDLFTDKGKVIVFQNYIDDLEEGETYKADGKMKEGTFIVTGDLYNTKEAPF